MFKNERVGVSMTTLTYIGVSQEQVDSLTKELTNDKASVVANPSTPGTFDIVGHGVEALATYDSNSLVLTVVVKSKPFYITMDHIKNSISEKLTAAGGPDVAAKG